MRHAAVLDGMGETETGPHTDGSDAETMAETVTRGDQYDLTNLCGCGSKFLNDLVQQGKLTKHVDPQSLPSL